MKLFFRLIFLFFSLFSFAEKLSLNDLKIHPETEFFFTETENCYTLTIPNIEPNKIEMTLPELPLGVKFISSKKEVCLLPDGKRGCKISLYFSFDLSGKTQFSPLLTKINGNPHYFEFENITVLENPSKATPRLEIFFDGIKKHQNEIFIKEGENLNFTVSLKNAEKLLDFKWELPKDSIFLEKNRFDITEKTKNHSSSFTESQKLARFEWKILKQGVYFLPNFSAEIIDLNGEQTQISLSANTKIFVSENSEIIKKDSTVIEEAFAENQTERSQNQKITKKEPLPEAKLSFFDRLFSRKIGIFKGGKIFNIPEEKKEAQVFENPQKVKITQSTGNWLFIECEFFSGWTQKNNVIKLK